VERPKSIITYICVSSDEVMRVDMSAAERQESDFGRSILTLGDSVLGPEEYKMVCTDESRRHRDRSRSNGPSPRIQLTISYTSPDPESGVRRIIIFEVVRSPWMIVVRCSLARAVPMDVMRCAVVSTRKNG
jgi:hypothetical protein